MIYMIYEFRDHIETMVLASHRNIPHVFGVLVKFWWKEKYTSQDQKP